MAFYDSIKADRIKKAKDKYEELKIHIKSLDENNIINDWFPAHEYLILMEEKLKEQDKQLQEYKEFFSMMNKLLPKKMNKLC